MKSKRQKMLDRLARRKVATLLLYTVSALKRCSVTLILIFVGEQQKAPEEGIFSQQGRFID